MSHEDEMSIDERRKYLHKIQQRYREADRTEKRGLLDEMAAVTGLHRKSLIRLINMPLARKKRGRQRGKTYGAEVDDALRVIAESHDDICAERLQPSLVAMAEQLARHGELSTTETLLDQLGRISVSSVQRRLSRLLARIDPDGDGARALRSPVHCCARCRWDAFPGTSDSRVTSRSTWSTIADPAPPARTSVRCK